MIKKTTLFVLLALTSLLIAPGCASVTRKRTQEIPVTSFPVAAMVSVNGQPQGLTPLAITLVRKQKYQVIRIESPGYNPVEIRPKRIMSSGPILGNLFLGVILGMLPAMVHVEAQHDSYPNATSFLIWGGAAADLCGVFTSIDAHARGHAFIPKELRVTLTKADGTPRVDTMVIGAEDFQNIKWIRVRRD